ncbi:MAG: tetratricopeptide repeat protein, partial [Candidatus Odinarchaeota archaeon]
IKLIGFLLMKAVVFTNRGEHDKACETVKKADGLLNSNKSKSREYFRAKAYILEQKGDINYRTARLKESLKCHEEALEMREIHGRDEEVASSRGRLGVVHTALGNDIAPSFFKKAIEINQKLNIKKMLARDMFNFGLYLRWKGQLNEAFEYCKSTSEVFKAIGDKYLLSKVYLQLGSLSLGMAELEKALDFYWKALDLDIDLNNDQAIANTDMNIARVLMHKGELFLARIYHKRSLKVAKDRGEPNLQAINLFQLSDIAIEMENISEAEKRIEELRELNEKSESKFVDLYYRLSLANLLKSDPEKMEEAIDRYQAMIEEDTLHYQVTGRAMLDLGEIYLEKYLWDMKPEHLDKTVEHFEKTSKTVFEKGWAVFSLGAQLLEGKICQVKLDLERSEDIFQKLLIKAKELDHDKIVKRCEDELRNIENYKGIDKWGDEQARLFAEKGSKEFFDYAKMVKTMVGT